MGVVLVGAFMVVLDTTVVNLGLPSMQEEFATVEGIEWVVTAYLAAVGVAQMGSGWVADRFGRKRAFTGALAIFTAASVACAAAPTLPALVAARIVQGLGGGLLMPVAMAMIYELFEPEERGRALSYFGIAVMAAPAIGPVLGGSLVSSLSWRWLFLINVPIGLVGIPVALRLLRDAGGATAGALDRRGLALSAVGLSALLAGFDLGGRDGWLDPLTLALLGAGAVALAVFVRHALTTPEPLVDLRILAHPVFAVGMVTVGLVSVAQYARLVYVPLELGTARGVAAFHIGLVMLPSAVGVAAAMPVGGRLVDRVGARLPVTAGVLVLLGSFWALAGLTLTTPLWAVAAILFVGGLGSGLCVMAPNVVAMNAVARPKVAQASGLSSLSRRLGAAIGTAVLAALFAGAHPEATAGGPGALGSYRLVFEVGVGLLAVAAVVAQLLPGKAGALALQEERRRELDEEGGAAEAEALAEAPSWA